MYSVRPQAGKLLRLQGVMQTEDLVRLVPDLL